jgi:hypothetical protein
LALLAEKGPKGFASHAEERTNFHFVPNSNSLAEFDGGPGEKPPETSLGLVVGGVSREYRSAPPPGAFSSKGRLAKRSRMGLPGIAFPRFFPKFGHDNARAEFFGEFPDESLVAVTLFASPTVIHMQKRDLRPHSPAVPSEKYRERRRIRTARTRAKDMRS